MKQLHQPFTWATWMVKPGNEEAFIAAWKAFAEWSVKNQPGAADAYLLQDLHQPRQFASFGAWETLDAIKAWRESNEFKDFVSSAKSLCDEFYPHTFHLVAAAG